MKTAMNRRIRILITSQTLDRGGLEEAVYATAAGLDKRRFEVHVAYMVGGEVADRLGQCPGVHTVHIATRNRLKRLVALAGLARDTGAEILHNHFCWYGMPAGVLAGCRRIETVHNMYRWLTPVEVRAFSMACRWADRLIAVSGAVRAFAEMRFPGTRRRRWEVIHNGIDVDRFKRTDASAFRRALGIGGGELIAGFAGRLEEEKGLDHLLDAARLLQDQNAGIRIVIAGTGSREGRLRERSAALKLSNVLFTGQVRDTVSLMSAFDIAILPSLYEGLPLALIEAMAAGCPVVASRVGGIPEAVDDGVQGVLVQAGSAEQLARAIAFLAGDPAARSAMGKAAEVRARERFSQAQMISQIEHLYLDLAAQGVA
jgi:glycosyltransferase involved in cell wall biosynthesis